MTLTVLGITTMANNIQVDKEENKVLSLDNIDKAYEIYIRDLMPGVYTYVDTVQDTGLIRLRRPDGGRYSFNVTPEILKDLISCGLIAVKGIRVTAANKIVLFDNDPEPITDEALEPYKVRAKANKQQREEEFERAHQQTLLEKQQNSKQNRLLNLSKEQGSGVKGILKGIQGMMDIFSQPSPSSSSTQSQSRRGLGEREPIDRTKPASSQIQDDFRYNNPNLGVRRFNRAMRDIYGIK